MEENLLTKIQNLMASGNGNTGRLQFIMECIWQGKTLYRSDQVYLEKQLVEQK